MGERGTGGNEGTGESGTGEMKRQSRGRGKRVREGEGKGETCFFYLDINFHSTRWRVPHTLIVSSTHRENIVRSPI